MPPEEVLQEVEAWIRKAESDFKNIALVLPAEDAPYDTVYFHAQQAAEKYLKALLTFHGVPFRRTHDLSELVLLLPASSSVANAVGDLSELTDAAVAVRYPDDQTDYQFEDAQALVENAERVKVAVLADLAANGYVAP